METELRDQEIIVLHGVPRSGKTTWARAYIDANPIVKRLSRDDLRNMVDNGTYSPAREKFILELRDVLIERILIQGYSVLLDDTNLKERDLQQLTFGAPTYMRGKLTIPCRSVFFNTPLEECIRRDSLRVSPIGAKRILEMYDSFLGMQDITWLPSTSVDGIVPV